MPFTPINIVNGSTPANATWGNNAQVQYTEATNSFNQDEYTPFVLSGLTTAKDGSIANQLDIAAGVAYPLQADATIRRRAVSATTKTTSAVSSTYYLYVQPDGTLYWSTVNTPAANSLFIAQVTTDVSGNISTVTDKRVTGTTILSGAVGAPMFTTLSVAHLLSFYGGLFGSFNATVMGPDAGARPAGQVAGQVFQIWTGSTVTSVLAIGSSDGRNGLTMLGTAGQFTQVASQATVGSLGVPGIVAQALQVPVTVTGSQTILSYTPSVTGYYRLSAWCRQNNGASGQLVIFEGSYHEAITNTLQSVFFYVHNGTTLVTLNGSNSLVNGFYPTAGHVVYAQAGQIINFVYNDPANTPNDVVSCFIERMN